MPPLSSGTCGPPGTIPTEAASIPAVTSPGTDWSQQTGAEVTFNGTTVTATIAAAGATITLTGYTVLATDVGNVLNIVSGTGSWTAGRYTITSVSTGSNTWTFAVNVAAGASSALVGYMGGALATIAKGAAVAVSANTVWVKATATYTITATITITLTNNATPIFYSGYTTTHGDGGQATITCATNSVHMWTMAGDQNYVLSNFRMTCTAGTPGDCIHCSSQTFQTVIVNCYISGFKYGVNGTNSGGAGYFTNLLVDSCEITACTSDGINNVTPFVVLASYIHGNTGCGLNVGDNCNINLVVQYSVIKSNAGTAGIYFPSSNQATACVITNSAIINNTGDGLRFSSGSTALFGLLMWSTIIDSNGGYGINAISNVSVAWGPSFRNNAFGSGATANTSGNYSSLLSASPSDVTLTADPFTSRSTGNFALNSTAGGGAALKGAGYDLGNTSF